MRIQSAGIPLASSDNRAGRKECVGSGTGPGERQDTLPLESRVIGRV